MVISKKSSTFAPAFERNAIFRVLDAKVGVASSSLVFRSFFFAIRQKGTKTSGCETQFCRPKSVAQHIGVIERLAASHAKC